MKFLVSFWALLAPVWLSAQSQVWQVPIVYHDLQLRLPQATVLDSIIFDAPVDGQVFLRFDGHCTATVGDRIILAASYTNDWDSNDGNTDVRPVDSLHLTQCFNHTRVYNVTAGQNIMYAVAHNIVDTDGNGIASIDGQFTVSYIPNEDVLQRLSGKGVISSGFIFTNDVKVFDQITIEVPEAGQLMANYEGRCFMDYNDTALFVLSLDTLWPAQPDNIEISFSNDNYFTQIVQRQLMDVGQGTYTIYLLGRKTGGNLESNENFINGTLSTQFIPDAQAGSILVSDSQEDKDILPGVPQKISELEIQVPENGTILLSYAGLMNAGPEEIMEVSLVQEGPFDILLSKRIVQSFLTLEPNTAFSQSGYVKAQPGAYRFAVYADFDASSSWSGVANVDGLLTAQFLKDPVITAVDHTLSDGNELTWYPNPTTGLIYAKAPARNDTYLLSVYNANGQLVLQSKDLSSTNVSADLTKLPEGIYQVSVRKGDKVEMQSVLKVAPRN